MLELSDASEIVGSAYVDLVDDVDRERVLQEFVMFGAAGGKLKTGRYLDYPAYGHLGHRTTANLYTTFLNVAGSKAERFGMADPNLEDLDQTGPLAELLA